MGRSYRRFIQVSVQSQYQTAVDYSLSNFNKIWKKVFTSCIKEHIFVLGSDLLKYLGLSDSFVVLYVYALEVMCLQFGGPSQCMGLGTVMAHNFQVEFR